MAGVVGTFSYRCSTGEWFLLRSSDQGLIKVQVDGAGRDDVPVPADYDGTDWQTWR